MANHCSQPPEVILHSGIYVVRDDLFPGGTKARFLGELFNDADECVYASPAQGGAQTALAHTAARLGKRATIFVAKRKHPHDRAREALRVGAKILQVTPGHLNVVQARAKAYAADRGAKLIPFGCEVPEAGEFIYAAALAAIEAAGIEAPEEVWCACGSGVLLRGLMRAFPKALFNPVQVGRENDFKQENVMPWRYHKPFDYALPIDNQEFPADPQP